MNRLRTVHARALALSVTTVVAAARAEATPSCTAVSRDNLVACALSASLDVEVSRRELGIARARVVAASPLLPSNPVAVFSAGHRSAGALEATNFNASLSQEIEVGGQRGIRRDAAEMTVQAETHHLEHSRREAAVRAWSSYFDALAAREALHLAERLTQFTRTVATAARARADRGLIAPVDADVAEAAAVHAERERFAAERRALGADAELTLVVGGDLRFPVRAEGALVPLRLPAAAAGDPQPKASPERPELAELDAERRAATLRADTLRRSRVPNPSISVFVQNDGFNERVLGAGVSLPIPIPGNVGRTYNGEIAELEATSLRLSAERERVARILDKDLSVARGAFESLTREVSALTPERLERAETHLRALAEEVELGRLAVRDAVHSQQALIELLQSSVEARRAWCLASVFALRASGYPLDRSTP